MNLKKKCKVVMLPTNEKASVKYKDIAKYPEFIENDLSFPLNSLVHNPKFLNSLQIVNGSSTEPRRVLNGWTKQHLYIVSDDEIKEDDYVIDSMGELFGPYEKGDVIGKEAKKIVAATNISLQLLQPSPQFIQKYIKEWNKGNKIEWINVEYESDYQLKVDKNNYITITKIKDSWNREEVKELLHKCWLQATAKTLKSLTQNKFKTFIEENL